MVFDRGNFNFKSKIVNEVDIFYDQKYKKLELQKFCDFFDYLG